MRYFTQFHVITYKWLDWVDSEKSRTLNHFHSSLISGADTSIVEERECSGLKHLLPCCDAEVLRIRSFRDRTVMRIIDASSTVPIVASKYKWVHVSNEITFSSCDILVARPHAVIAAGNLRSGRLQLVLPELAQFGRSRRNTGEAWMWLKAVLSPMLSVEFRNSDIRQQCCRHRPQVVLKCRRRYQLLELWRLLCNNRWRWQVGTPVGTQYPVAGLDGAPVLMPSLLSSTSVPANMIEAMICNIYLDDIARLQRLHLLLDEVRFRRWRWQLHDNIATWKRHKRYAWRWRRHRSIRRWIDRSWRSWSSSDIKGTNINLKEGLAADASTRDMATQCHWALEDGSRVDGVISCRQELLEQQLAFWAKMIVQKDEVTGRNIRIRWT